MFTHICLICERPAERPFAFMLFPNQDESAKVETKPPLVICQECMWEGQVECTVDQIERDISRGKICHLCFEPLYPPGGTTMPTLDGRRLLRVCWSCKEVFQGVRAK